MTLTAHGSIGQPAAGAAAGLEARRQDPVRRAVDGDAIFIQPCIFSIGNHSGIAHGGARMILPPMARYVGLSTHDFDLAEHFAAAGLCSHGRRRAMPFRRRLVYFISGYPYKIY